MLPLPSPRRANLAPSEERSAHSAPLAALIAHSWHSFVATLLPPRLPFRPPPPRPATGAVSAAQQPLPTPAPPPLTTLSLSGRSEADRAGHRVGRAQSSQLRGRVTRRGGARQPDRVLYRQRPFSGGNLFSKRSATLLGARLSAPLPSLPFPLHLQAPRRPAHSPCQLFCPSLRSATPRPGSKLPDPTRITPLTAIPSFPLSHSSSAINLLVSIFYLHHVSSPLIPFRHFNTYRVLCDKLIRSREKLSLYGHHLHTGIENSLCLLQGETSL